jgi:hydroxymethylpyrimidine/phosphomethylpyrimidine kinase
MTHTATDVPVTLTIAGSDSCAGAGIQADLKTFQALECYGCTTITCSTAQNPNAVNDIESLSVPHIRAQLSAVSDAFAVSAIKIGMIGSSTIANVLVEELSRFKTDNIVIDPVLSASSGQAFANESIEQIYVRALFPQAMLITPNFNEAQRLFGHMSDERNSTTSLPDKPTRALINTIQNYANHHQIAVLLKGGHACVDHKGGQLTNSIEDLLIRPNKIALSFLHARIETIHTHGTGCVLSSAITAYLARRFSLEDSVEKAINYLQTRLRTSNDYLITKTNYRENLPFSH